MGGNGYSNSKAVAEKMIERVGQRGLFCTLHRFGAIEFDYVTGEFL